MLKRSTIKKSLPALRTHYTDFEMLPQTFDCPICLETKNKFSDMELPIQRCKLNANPRSRDVQILDEKIRELQSLI